ncbi:MAG TPA: IS630 family transposase, partial [Longimicrobium sp.]
VHRETSAWTKARNAQGATVTWRFTSSHARTKLQRLYPSPSAR